MTRIVSFADGFTSSEDQEQIDVGIGLVDSILLYGADSSGLTSSNQAFLDCIADNGSAYVPNGTFTVGDLEINGGRIYGNGKIKRLTGATHAIKLKGNNPQIDGLKFESTGSAGNGTSEINLMDSCFRPEVKNCTFTGALYAVITADENGETDASLTYVNPVDGFLFQNCKVSGLYSRHLYLHSVKNIRIVNNDFRDSQRDCIRLRQETSKCLISGNNFSNIGKEYPEIIERPQNWLSIQTYVLNQVVSVPPFGIYRCIKATGTTTMGQNPATSGAADWTNIAPSYFETADVLDAYWSGQELIITNNIIDKTASFGMDIKGTNPEGTYSSGKVLISNNIIKNCFGVALNLSYAALDSNNQFHYIGQFVISNNYFSGNNRERIDLSQSPITLRMGIRNVTISNNIIEKNYARGITVANLDGEVGITKNVILTDNQILSNGIPGHPSSIGMNIAPVDGLIVKNNIVRNIDRVEEYKAVVAGTASSSGTLTIPTRGNIATISVPYLSGDDASVISQKIYNNLISSAYLVPWETVTAYYYGSVRIADSVFATSFDSTNQMKFTSKLNGSLGNGQTVTIVTTAGGNLFPVAGDFVLSGNNLTVNCRTTTKPFNFLAAFVSNASLAVKALFSFELKEGISTIAANQAAVVNGTSTMAGGENATEVFFDARIDNAINPGTFSGNGFSVALTKDPFASNSVQAIAMSVRDYEIVGDTTFRAPRLNYVIRDNFVDGNSPDPRFNIQFNFTETPALIAYVDSVNTFNDTPIVPVARIQFSGGANSGASSHLSSQASLVNQGIILKARSSGAGGNRIGYKIEQPVTNNQILRLLIAPAVFGGYEINVLLPTDAVGAPIVTTVAQVENLLLTRLGQGIMTYENNYIGNSFRPQVEISQGSDGQGLPVGGTTGQYLTKTNGTDFVSQWTTLPDQSLKVDKAWNIISKISSDFTTSSDVMADTGLTFNIGANETWLINLAGQNGCNNVGGLKYLINTPAGSVTRARLIGTTSGNTALTSNIMTTNTECAVNLNTVNSTGGFAEIIGTVVNGATAGVVKIQIRSITNTQTSTLFKESTLQATRIS